MKIQATAPTSYLDGLVIDTTPRRYRVSWLVTDTRRHWCWLGQLVMNVAAMLILLGFVTAIGFMVGGIVEFHLN